MSLPEEKLLMRAWDDGEASLVRQILESHGIPCRVVSDIPHSVFPVTVDGLGEIRILVPESRFDEASEILAESRRSGLEPLTGGEPSGEDAS